MAFASINPATGKKIRSFREYTKKEVEARLARARETFSTWGELTFEKRAALLCKVATVLRERKETYARLITDEMGKPVTQALLEIERCALCCEFYARHAEEFLKPERSPAARPGGYVVYRPMGTLLAIMPWNFPFWQAFRAAAPALMAGNVVILKHASNVSACALAIEESFLMAGLPAGAFSTLLISTAKLQKVIADPRVAAVTLTGSTAAGKAVAAQAGAAMKKGVFELGGSDPYLILADADIDEAAEICAKARLINSGQSCVCAKRFIVVEKVRAVFEEKFVAGLAARIVGSPTESKTEVGPIARADLRDELHSQVVKSVKRGAKILLGGKLPAGAGYYYPPTVLTNVRKGMPAYDEELFGPVAAIIPVKNEAQAIEVANDSIYGLGAAVFTKDRERGEKIAVEKLHAGLAAVNDSVKSDPALPFGGIKQSGYGRELGSHGIREFVIAKTITVR